MPKKAPNNPWATIPDMKMSGVRANTDMYNALKARYGQQTPEQLHDTFLRELGLGAYNIPLLKVPKLSQVNDAGAYGHQSHESAYIGDFPDEDASSVVHELGHAADDIYYPEPVQSGLHHSKLKNLDAELANSINAQTLKELGVPPTHAQNSAAPWLRDVNPYSSNKLASPWAGSIPEYPADIFNATGFHQNDKEIIQSILNSRKVPQ